MATKKNSRSRNFRISPSTTAVQIWARDLLSPSAQDVQVPQWYLKAAEKAETRQKSRGGGRYNLRPRTQQAEEPLKPQSPLNQARKNKKNQLKDTPPPPIKQTRYNLRQPPAPVNKMPNRKPPAGNQRKQIRINPADVSQSPEASVPSDQASTIRPSRVRATSDILNSTTTRQTSTVERRSGMQKLIKLLKHKPEFIYNYSLEESPKTVQELCVRLRNAAHQYEEIIPGDLESWITRDYPLEAIPDGMLGALSLTVDEENATKALYTRVQNLYLAMMRQNGVNAGVEEAAWYGIITNALGQFQSSPKGANELDLNFRNLIPITCTTNAIIQELLPYDSDTGEYIKSAKVDHLIGYDPMQKPWRELLKQRKRRKLDSVPLAPLQTLEETFIGVIPVEVKNATGDSIDSRYQLVLCASGMLRLRRVWATSSGDQQKKEYDPENPPVVVALSIIGHIWSYYVIFLGTPEESESVMAEDPDHLDSIPRVVLGPFMAGHTMGILPTCHLFHFLTVLREWVVTEWAPVVYEELAATAPAASTPPKVAES